MNKSIKSVVIITGSAIGSGTFALPMIISSIGLIPTIVMLSFFWYIMYKTALMLAELFIIHKQKNDFAKICYKELGKFGCILGLSSELLLILSLVVSYLMCLIAILNYAFPLLFENINYLYVMILLITFSVLVKFYQESWFLTLLSSLPFIISVVLLLFGISTSDNNNFTLTNLYNSNLNFSYVPILFICFGFHFSINKVIDELNYNRKEINNVIFWGSLVPLIFYILCCCLLAGLVPLEGENSFSALDKSNMNLNVLIKILANISNNSLIFKFVLFFSFCTIVNSLCLASKKLILIVNQFNNTSAKISLFKILSYTFILLSTVLYTYHNPKGFIFVMHNASLGLFTTSIIFPILISLLRGLKKESSSYKNIYEMLFLLVIGFNIFFMDLIL